jgi:hydroxyacid-oxoacid transhydrogenase
MAASNLRFGQHATREVGMDFTNMIAQLPASERANAKIGVFTDPNVAKLDVMKIVEESLLKEGLNFVTYDKVAVEPTDKSWTVSPHVLLVDGAEGNSRQLTLLDLDISPIS